MTRSLSPSRSAPTLLAAAVLLGSAGPAAAADFEGVIESRATMAGHADGSGTARTFVSAAGTRQEMTMGAKGQSMSMVTLVLKAKPGKAFMVNDEKKTYSEIDVAALKAAGEKSPEKFTARRLGSAKVAGYGCAHGLVEGSKGARWEVWTTRDIAGDASFWAEQAGEKQGGAGAGIFRAMKDAGLDGWPLKWVVKQKGPDGGEAAVTWEATKVERRSLSGSLFSLSGYTRSEDGPMGAMGQMKLPPEQQKQMDEMMKNLTPEQRKQMQEMMQKTQGAQRPKGN
jgi:hypothetical protein